jgi:hypothetical protein
MVGKKALRQVALLVALGCLLSVHPTAGRAADAGSSDEVLHRELRALKDRATNAVNKRDEAALLQELDPNIAFTAMNNEVVHGTQEAKAYYERMMTASDRLVQDMSITIEPDALTTLYNGGMSGVSTGTSNAHFKLKTGMEFDIPLRWTATLVRSQDRWLLAGIQFSANVFDNPIMSGLKTTMTWVATGAAIAALVIGFFACRFWSRRRS